MPTASSRGSNDPTLSRAPADAAVELLYDLDSAPQTDLEQVDVDDPTIELGDDGVQLLGGVGVTELGHRHRHRHAGGVGRAHGDPPSFVAVSAGGRISSTTELALPCAKVVISLPPGRSEADDRTILPDSSRVSVQPRSSWRRGSNSCNSSR